MQRPGFAVKRQPFDHRARRIALAVEQARVKSQLMRSLMGERRDVLVARALLNQRNIAKIKKHEPVLEQRVKPPGIHGNTAGETACKFEVRTFIKENDESQSPGGPFDIKTMLLVICQVLMREALAVVQGHFHERLPGIADQLILVGLKLQDRPASDRPNPGLRTLELLPGLFLGRDNGAGGAIPGPESPSTDGSTAPAASVRRNQPRRLIPSCPTRFTILSADMSGSPRCSMLRSIQPSLNYGTQPGAESSPDSKETGTGRHQRQQPEGLLPRNFTRRSPSLMINFRAGVPPESRASGRSRRRGACQNRTIGSRSRLWLQCFFRRARRSGLGSEERAREST